MKQAFALLTLAAVLPACGWLEDLMGGDEKQNERRRMPSPVTPIAPEKLASLLPKLQGWNSSVPEGTYVQSGRDKFSRSTCTYTRKDGDALLSATLIITDGSHVANINAPLARMAHTGPNNPHTLGISVHGYHGLQQWQPDSGKVSAALMVAHRFLITLEGENLSPEMVTGFLGSIDLRLLGSWGDAN